MKKNTETSINEEKTRKWINQNLKLLIISFFVGFFIIGICWILSNEYTKSLEEQKRAIIQANIDKVSMTLSSNISQRQAILRALAASAKTHGVKELSEKHFGTFAFYLKTNDPMIRALQFFPVHGSVLVYPVEGNEAVVGRTLDQLINDERPGIAQDVQRTIDSREITLSDPYELRQGGVGVVARLAVYDNNEIFLGLVTVILDINPIFNIAELEELQTDNQLAIRDSKRNVFWGSEELFDANPVTSKIILPENSWEIGLVPNNGWLGDYQVQIILFWAAGFLIAMLSGTVVFQLSSKQGDLRRLVNLRTAELAVNEKRYETTHNLVREGIWEWDLSKNSKYVNTHFYHLLGHKDTGSILSQDWMCFVHPEDQEIISTAVNNCIQKGKDFTLQMRMITKNGEQIHVINRGRVAETDPNGVANRIVGTINDMSDQKRVEGQLRESEAKFRAMFNNNHAAMLLIEPDSGRIMDANPAACNFYGWAYETIISMNIKEVNIQNQLITDNKLRKASLLEENYFQFQHRTANGEIRDVEVFAGPIEHAGKKLLFSIVHDITARKIMERALAESEARYAQLLQLAPIGIMVLDRNNILFTNPTGASLLGAANSDQVINRLLSEFVSGEQNKEIQSFLENYSGSKKQTILIEENFRFFDGTEKYLGIIVSPIIYQGLEAYQVIAQDISDRKKAEKELLSTQIELRKLLSENEESRKVLLSIVEDQRIAEEKLNKLNLELEERVKLRTIQLEAANKELEAFAYSVSHDLRAPLRGIDGWSMALLEDYYEKLDEDARIYLQRVRAETKRMAQLIDDLLRLSRVTRQDMQFDTVNLTKMATTIYKRLSEEKPTWKGEVEIEENMLAYGDSSLIEIMLNNLLANAVKFSSKESKSFIEFGRTMFDNRQVFFIRDNGVGFDMTYAKNLFGAFQRMHKQSDFPGTGVGLATVQRIINRHGGAIWAEAEKGQGATFYFTLPESQ